MNAEEIRNILKKGTVLENEPMIRHTTMKCGGPAKIYAVPYDTAELSELIRNLHEDGTEFFVTGNGSNLLVSDEGYDGVIIHIGKEEGTAFTDIVVHEEEEGSFIEAGAGALMTVLGKMALKYSLTGFEPLSGIPGCVGGACIMNAGAYGGEIKDIAVKVDAILPDGKRKEFIGGELSFRYRGSSLADCGAIVTKAWFRLEKGNEEEIRAAMEEFTNRRKDKQPIELPSAGSTFKRPEGYFAGKLIQDAGLKGYRVGGASVSEKHAGFVVNDQNGTAEDVYRLIRHIQNKVFEDFGVMLEPEVKMLGNFYE